MSDEQAPAVSARGEGAGDAERYAKVRERWDALADKQRANRISWFREFHRVDQEMSDWDIIPPDLFCQCEHSWPCDPVVLLAANDRLERDLAAALLALGRVHGLGGALYHALIELSASTCDGKVAPGVEARINSALENWLARHDPPLAEARGTSADE
jgi:hypothetical protein